MVRSVKIENGENSLLQLIEHMPKTEFWGLKRITQNCSLNGNAFRNIFSLFFEMGARMCHKKSPQHVRGPF